MTNDAILLIKGLINNTVNLMNGITVPGLNMTYFQLFLTVFSIYVIIAGVKYFFGLGSGSSNGLNRNSSNIKISEKRRGDTK